MSIACRHAARYKFPRLVYRKLRQVAHVYCVSRRSACFLARFVSRFWLVSALNWVRTSSQMMIRLAGLPVVQACGMTILRMEMATHVQDECLHRPADCPYQSLGCVVQVRFRGRRVFGSVCICLLFQECSSILSSFNLRTPISRRRKWSPPANCGFVKLMQKFERRAVLSCAGSRSCSYI